MEKHVFTLLDSKVSLKIVIESGIVVRSKEDAEFELKRLIDWTLFDLSFFKYELITE